MSTSSSSVSGRDFPSDIEDKTEKSLLIATDSSHESIRSTTGSASFGMPRRKPGQKRSMDTTQSKDSVEIMNLSTTTVIGLLLLLAMITLTILSICLQRYSTNTYVDIIVPPHNSSNSNGSIEIIPELIL